MGLNVLPYFARTNLKLPANAMMTYVSIEGENVIGPEA